MQTLTWIFWRDFIKFNYLKVTITVCDARRLKAISWVKIWFYLSDFTCPEVWYSFKKLPARHQWRDPWSGTSSWPWSWSSWGWWRRRGGCTSWCSSSSSGHVRLDREVDRQCKWLGNRAKVEPNTGIIQIIH